MPLLEFKDLEKGRLKPQFTNQSFQRRHICWQLLNGGTGYSILILGLP